MRLCIVNAIGPPTQAGSRSERWAHLSRALAELGCDVTLIRSAPPSTFRGEDAGLHVLLEHPRIDPVTLPVTRIAEWRESAKSHSLGFDWFKRLAAESIWPDGWVGFAAGASKWLLAHDQKFDAVIASGYPWSDLLAAYDYGRSTGVPWFADYGDPWTLNWNGQQWSPTISSRWETRLLRHAAGICVTTPPTKDLFARSFGVPSEKLLVLPAGTVPSALPRPPAPPPLVIYHAGVVYGPRSSIRPFLTALERAKSTGIEIRLIWHGEVHRAEERELIESAADEYAPRVPLATVNATEARANLLVVFGNAGGTQAPGKIWRCLGSGREVLAVACDESDALYSLEEVRAHALVCRNDADSIESTIRTAIARMTDPATRPAPRVPSWQQRAEALLDFVETQRAHRPLHDRNANPSARQMIWMATLSGANFFKAMRTISRKLLVDGPWAKPKGS